MKVQPKPRWNVGRLAPTEARLAPTEAHLAPEEASETQW